MNDMCVNEVGEVGF